MLALATMRISRSLAWNKGSERTAPTERQAGRQTDTWTTGIAERIAPSHAVSHTCTCTKWSGAQTLSLMAPWLSQTYLGMPRVTFISPLPAKWKVLSVICVEGSPMLWAASSPTASPGSQRARCHFNCSRVLRLETGTTGGEGGHSCNFPLATGCAGSFAVPSFLRPAIH